MEPGRIVYFNELCTGHYIATNYNDQYLFLAVETFNRRDNFQATIDRHIDTGINITNFNLPEMIEYHIIEEEKIKRPVTEYKTGLILQDKITNKYYNMVITYNKDFKYEYFLLDLKTFELMSLREKIQNNDYYEQFEYVKKNYDTFDLYIYQLRLNIKGGIY